MLFSLGNMLDGCIYRKFPIFVPKDCAVNRLFALSLAIEMCLILKRVGTSLTPPSDPAKGQQVSSGS